MNCKATQIIFQKAFSFFKKEMRGLFSKKMVLVFLFFTAMLSLQACGVSYVKDADGNEIKEVGFKALLEKCWACPLYEVVLNTVGKLTFLIFNNLASYCRTLLALGLAFWLVFNSLNFISQFKNPRPTDFWRKILSVLLKAFVISLILSSETLFIWIFNSLILPVFQAFMTSSLDVLASPGVSSCNSYMTIDLLTQNFEITHFGGVGNDSMLPAALVEMMKAIIFEIQLSFSRGISFGYAIFSQNTFSSAFVGGGVLVLFLALTIVFPFYLLDGLIRSCLVLALLPFILVAWVFPATSKWVIKAWKLLISSLIQIFLFSVFTVLVVIVLSYISVGNGASIYTFLGADSEGYIKDALALSMEFLLVFAVCLYIFILVNIFFSLSKSFGGAPDSSVLKGFFGKAKAVGFALGKKALGFVGGFLK
ncbi:MAG: hypothetical protein EOM53_01220 [Alphaproteobacteria bacterium]|nr:hypothetical protein [Alphaproteobacteria bacterium]